MLYEDESKEHVHVRAKGLLVSWGMAGNCGKPSTHLAFDSFGQPFQVVHPSLPPPRETLFYTLYAQCEVEPVCTEESKETFS